MAEHVQHVDIAIVGAGLAGLASAAALHKVRPDAAIKVYERRPRPAADAPLSNGTGSTYISGGGGVRLETNGLRAAASISASLASQLLGHGVYARKVLLHDTAGQCVCVCMYEGHRTRSHCRRQRSSEQQRRRCARTHAMQVVPW
jgi:2-polyprenyl-6-methoxyphenol hydroxylase-like FAD-dependent oxidoreductase